MSYSKKIGFALILVSCCSGLAAAGNARHSELTITADKLKGFQKTATQSARTIYTGNVAINRGRFKIHGTQATVYFHAHKVSHVLVVGHPARFIWDPKKGHPAHGWANTITYYAGSGLVHLLGKAKIIRNGQTIAAPQMNYHLTNGSLHATGSLKDRVKVVLPTTPSTKGSQ